MAKKPKKTNSSNKEFYYDKPAAQKAIAFFPTFLTHMKGKLANKPFHLLPWQADEIIKPLFGWKRREDDSRKYRTCYVEIPRKNGKSTLAAGVALYMLFCDKEPGAEIYSCAASRDQASIIFKIAKWMVDHSPELRSRCEVFQKAIIIPETGSVYKAISSDAFSKHGENAHGIIFDELHVQPNRELWDVMTTSVGSRVQPITLALTTAGYDKTSLCWEQHEHARQIIEGRIADPEFLPVIYGMAPEEKWRSKRTWRRVNPSLGKTVPMRFLESEYRKAKQMPAYQNTFRRLYLNEWTSQESRWLDMEKWDACGRRFLLKKLLGRICYGGLDIASTIDIGAFVLVFPMDDGCFNVIAKFWIPGEGVVAKEKRDRVPYRKWIKQGYLTATPGDAIDYEAISEEIHDLEEIYNIKEIGFDRWGAIQLAQELQADGFTMVPITQKFSGMSAPMKEVGSKIISGHLRHRKNPILDWMADNLQAKQNSDGDLQPDKKKSRMKIDGMVAMIMAMDRAIRNIGTDEEEESTYETGGVFFV